MSIRDLKKTPVFDVYWYFAVKRQEVFFNRLEGKESLWTNDPIIQKYKFTNVYRASDRVSQYLIRNVIYSDNNFSPEDICFRILLFKLFNKIDTWECLERQLGEILYSSYNYEEYDRLLLKMLEEKEKIYSAAYIMPSGNKSFGYAKKHQNNLKLLEFIMKSNITAKISKSKSLKELYEILISYPTIGPFLAFQYCIDINYSELCDFSEMSFVVAGPGAKNGICKCFDDLKRYSYEDIIKYVTENQEKEFESRGLRFRTLFGRRMQLIDCQNLFCETDKYSRVAYPKITGLNSRVKIQQRYKHNNLEPIEYFYPPKWMINENISIKSKEKAHG